LFVVVGVLCSAGIGFAVADTPFGAFFGPVAATGLAALFALMLDPPRRVAHTAMVTLLALTGTATGLLLALLRDIEQPIRILFALVGAILFAVVGALVMSHRLDENF
jgi:hypothetical protein